MHRTLPFYFASYPAWQIIKINFYSQRIGDFLPAQQMLSKNMKKNCKNYKYLDLVQRKLNEIQEVAGLKKNILKVRPACLKNYKKALHIWYRRHAILV